MTITLHLPPRPISFRWKTRRNGHCEDSLRRICRCNAWQYGLDISVWIKISRGRAGERVSWHCNLYISHYLAALAARGYVVGMHDLLRYLANHLTVDTSMLFLVRTVLRGSRICRRRESRVVKISRHPDRRMSNNQGRSAQCDHQSLLSAAPSCDFDRVGNSSRYCSISLALAPIQISLVCTGVVSLSLEEVLWPAWSLCYHCSDSPWISGMNFLSHPEIFWFTLCCLFAAIH